MTTATATGPAAPLTFRDVPRIDVIRRIWYAQFVSLFGDFLALLAVLAVVSFRMHGTPAQLAGVQIAYMLPMVCVGPIAGVFVDRWPLKPTLGRVASTQVSIVFLGQILGLVLSGTLAEVFGMRMVFFFCAVLSVVLVGAGKLFLRTGANAA